MSKLLKSIQAASAATTLLMMPLAAAADPVADFYNGKQLQFIVRAAPGGNYDVYTRFLARYFAKHMPGNPTILTVNMPGGGGLKALGYVASVAPKDGTVMTMVTQSFPMEQALGSNKALEKIVDLRTLNWIGNMSEANQVIYTAPASNTHTLEGAKKQQTIIGATGIGATSTQLIALYNNALGTKFKIIYGYPGSAEIGLAMERGELEGRNTSSPPAVIAAAGGPSSPRAQFHFLLQTGIRKLADYQNVPLLTDIAANAQDRAAFDFISKASSVSRPFASATGIPAERVAALRKAFADTLRDPELIADAGKQEMEISLTTGEDLQKIVADMLTESPRVLDHIRDLIKIKEGSAEKAKGVKDTDGGE
jgi:tripartite-type tricarboxylate transporter receptor subunit TctC